MGNDKGTSKWLVIGTLISLIIVGVVLYLASRWK